MESAAPTVMPVRDRLVVVAFVVFTAFVWTQRLVNIAQGEETDVGLSIALSVGLLGLGVLSGLALVLVGWAGWPSVPAPAAAVWRVAAAATVVVWVVRAVQITLDWRSPGFVIVHVVLALVSILLAVGLWRVAGSGTWRVRRTPH
jgi:hypothetical protein